MGLGSLSLETTEQSQKRSSSIEEVLLREPHRLSSKMSSPMASVKRSWTLTTLTGLESPSSAPSEARSRSTSAQMIKTWTEWARTSQLELSSPATEMEFQKVTVSIWHPRLHAAP